MEWNREQTRNALDFKIFGKKGEQNQKSIALPQIRIYHQIFQMQSQERPLINAEQTNDWKNNFVTPPPPPRPPKKKDSQGTRKHNKSIWLVPQKAFKSLLFVREKVTISMYNHYFR